MRRELSAAAAKPLNGHQDTAFRLAPYDLPLSDGRFRRDRRQRGSCTLSVAFTPSSLGSTSRDLTVVQ